MRTRLVIGQAISHLFITKEMILIVNISELSCGSVLRELESTT